MSVPRRLLLTLGMQLDAFGLSPQWSRVGSRSSPTFVERGRAAGRCAGGWCYSLRRGCYSVRCSLASWDPPVRDIVQSSARVSRCAVFGRRVSATPGAAPPVRHGVGDQCTTRGRDRSSDDSFLYSTLGLSRLCCPLTLQARSGTAGRLVCTLLGGTSMTVRGALSDLWFKSPGQLHKAHTKR